MAGLQSDIERIRAASRRLVRHWGLLEDTLAGTAMPPSAVHAIVELGKGQVATAGDLATALGLEKSTISRLVARLIDDGLLREQRDHGDGRRKLLKLTHLGQQRFEAISAFADRQVRHALSRLDQSETEMIAVALDRYAAVLAGTSSAGRANGSTGAAKVEIVAGYRPALIGDSVAMHASYYAPAAGFGVRFETKVAREMAEFVTRMDREPNRFWSAVQGTRTVGTIVIDGEDIGGGVAHLRWFIVGEGVRGQGVGRRLIDAAMDFVDAQGFSETRLWTFSGLDAARRLYEQAGFTLAEEKTGRQWGRQVTEQQFVRRRPP